MIEELKHILLVEDDPDFQEIARVSLELVGGLTLTVCSSGQEAIENAASINPQLILLDVMMPGMDGVETLSALKKLPALNSTPVVFLTAKSSQPSEVAHYLNLGAIGIIPKPFDPMQLAAQVRELWAYSCTMA